MELVNMAAEPDVADLAPNTSLNRYRAYSGLAASCCQWFGPLNNAIF